VDIASTVGRMTSMPLDDFRSERGFRQLSRRLDKVDLLDWLLFIPSIGLAAGLGISLRLIGPFFVLVPIGSCLLYASLRRCRPPATLTIYIAYCICSATLSAFKLLPPSWQIHFMTDAIVRQLVPPIGFFAVAWASKAFYSRLCLPTRPILLVNTMLFLALVVAPAVMLDQGLRYRSEEGDLSALALYGALINNMIIAVFFLTAFVFFSPDLRRYLSLAVILGIAVTSPFIQFKLFTIIILATLFGVPGRLVALSFVGALMGIYAIELGDIPAMMKINPDAGLRLQLIVDAWVSLLDTWGLGIGYGTESVHWIYEVPGLPRFTFLPNPNFMTHEQMLEALSRGVHNSFVQALLRTGLLGGTLLILAFVSVFPPPNLHRSVRDHASVAFSMIFLACFVNPALESPVQVVGIGLVYGYLLVLRATARAAKAVPRP
jgi:hypothetical protein